MAFFKSAWSTQRLQKNAHVLIFHADHLEFCTSLVFYQINARYQVRIGYNM